MCRHTAHSAILADFSPESAILADAPLPVVCFPMDHPIRLRGASQHNLANLDLDIPRRAFTVITGPSGSGKSSLALDTLFAEGQRRYVESLSTYAKQFLDRMRKPRVESVEGIPPAVAIEQKNPTRSSRSTVGTATEVYDYLRLLWARVGHTHCPRCGRRIQRDTVSGAVERVLSLPEGERIMVAFPLQASERATHAQVAETLRASGFLRVLADDAMIDLAEAGSGDPAREDGDLAREDGDLARRDADLAQAREALVVVDRLAVRPSVRDRLADSLGVAFVQGLGEAVIVRPSAASDEARLRFTERFRCPFHPDIEFPDPTPKLFSFNSPYGSCATCTGFGATLEYDEELIVPNEGRSLAEGAVDPWEKPRYVRERARLRAFARTRRVGTRTPWRELPEGFREEVLRGSPDFVGIIPFLRSRERQRRKQFIRVFLRRYQSAVACAGCGGARIRGEALNVRVGDRTLPEVCAFPMDELLPWIDGLALSAMEENIAETILREIRDRLSFLVDVGLGYLTLSRQTRTLSGGEAQRINLANALGSRLVDTLYVLDEPTVGLHPRDTAAMLALLRRLARAGNTVVVVEHDPQVIVAADHVIELGPESGEKGGRLVFEGPPAGLPEAGTATGRLIAGAANPSVSCKRGRPGGRIELRGARLHNLRDVDVDVPLRSLTVVTGVSGSGKSTLVNDVLYRALEREMNDGETTARVHIGELVGEYRSIANVSHLADVARIDQSPIGRTPRSNSVTYIKAWDEVRKLFAVQPLARRKRYQARHFSFNVAAGRCEACRGAGQVEIEMIFMADVYVACDVCRGTRFKREILDVTYKGLNIAQVLELTVDQAIRFFIKQARLGKMLWHLQDVGLGYLRLGQPAPTLSGGEAQRLKIARELSGAAGRRGSKLYILDEPTTGLSGNEVAKLLRVLTRLIDAGNTVIVIEHNLDVIRAADWIIDLGPGAGARGGRVVAMGRPREVMAEPASVTGACLVRLPHPIPRQTRSV